MIVNPETYEPFQKGENWIDPRPWRQCVCGIFESTIPSPFIMKNEVKWFITGDLGYLNAQGYLIVTDRWRRFIRIAGETISFVGKSNTGW